MVLGSTQPLTEMSTSRNLSEYKGRSAHKSDNITAICVPITYEIWDPRRFTTPWVSTVCFRDSFTFLPFSLEEEFVVDNKLKVTQTGLNKSTN
jgi:hypothetical protein